MLPEMHNLAVEVLELLQKPLSLDLDNYVNGLDRANPLKNSSFEYIDNGFRVYLASPKIHHGSVMHACNVLTESFKHRFRPGNVGVDKTLTVPLLYVEFLFDRQRVKKNRESIIGKKFKIVQQIGLQPEPEVRAAAATHLFKGDIVTAVAIQGNFLKVQTHTLSWAPEHNNRQGWIKRSSARLYDVIPVKVRINNKFITTLDMSRDVNLEDAKKMALSDFNISAHFNGRIPSDSNMSWEKDLSAAELNMNG